MEINTYLYIQETGKVQLYIGPAYALPKPLLSYITSLYAYTLRIYKPLMSSTNYKLIYTYTGYMLIREKQRVGLSTPSTSLKYRVSILPIYIWHILTIYIARPNPAR